MFISFRDFEHCIKGNKKETEIYEKSKKTEEKNEQTLDSLAHHGHTFIQNSIPSAQW